MVYFITKKGEDGKPHSIPITPPSHPALHMALRAESPNRKFLHARRIGSVLADKSIRFGHKVNEKRKQIEQEKKDRVKKFDDYIDEILDDNELAPKQKFRRLQRFAHDNWKRLSERQRTQVNQELQELDLKHDITPDPVEQPTKASVDKNPNPVTFASLDEEHDNITASVNKNTPQKEIDEKADRLNEIEHKMDEEKPTKDEQALNDIAHEIHGKREKSKLPETTQAEVDLEKRKL